MKKIVLLMLLFSPISSFAQGAPQTKPVDPNTLTPKELAAMIKKQTGITQGASIVFFGCALGSYGTALLAAGSKDLGQMQGMTGASAGLGLAATLSLFIGLMSIGNSANLQDILNQKLLPPEPPAAPPIVYPWN